MTTDTEHFATELRARLDLDALHSTIDPAVALARGRRSARRRAMGTAAMGVVAVSALSVAALQVPGLLDRSPVSGPGAPTAVVDGPRPTAALVAEGVTAATGVTGSGSPWDTGLSWVTPAGADEISVAAGTGDDLADALSATGVPVDHALRVVLGDVQAPSASAVIAWADDEQPAPVHDPSVLTMYNAGGTTDADELPRASRLFAGVVPSWLGDARVVFFTAGSMSDPTGAAVHAVEIPTFADPSGTGARIYVAVASADIFAGPRPRGIFFVNPDGTLVDAEGTCALAPDACTADRADGLDLQAELLSAVQP